MKSPTIKNIAFFLILFSAFRLTAGDTLSLNDAVTKKKVSVIITGIDPGKGITNTHIGECIKMTLKNLTTQALVILVQAGRILKNKDDKVQDMVVTKGKNIPLAASATTNVKINALCAELFDASPDASSVFTFGEMCNNDLKKVVREIESGNFQNNTGQNAVWCVTDHLQISDLTDLCKDKIKTSNLVKSVSKALKMPVPRAYANAKVSQRINFTYILKDSAVVKITFYDKEGNHVLNFLNSMDKAPGEYQESYWISDADVEPGDYVAQLTINGVPMISQNINF